MAIEAKTAVPSAAANGKHGHTLISDAKFRQLYGLALRLQLLARNANGAGQDLALRGAALTSVTADMGASDTLIASLDSCAVDLLSAALPCLVNPKRSASSDDGVVDAIAAATADRLRGGGRVTVVFAPQRTAILREAKATAIAAKLPILFVEAEPHKEGSIDDRGAAKIPDAGEPWLPSIAVDAQDIVALYRVAHESMTRARLGGGPTQIACLAWPVDEQRKKKAGYSTDAVSHLEQWLEARGLPAHEWRREIAADFETRG